ncbi:AI-2E family transporter [Salinibacterium sp. ZJ454]|uniref:AI-2E family transporter n=1 Tax=Salinibacterium sp. ZJ454 TaxID=2708339 RepID=UPI001FBBCEA8|nr:AI-2E family transporter [Salinibacterium sp. ZJ454]
MTRRWRFWRKHRQSSVVAPTAPAISATRPSSPLPRAVAILIGVGGASVAVFGLWALRGVVAPVFLALILTICVHPLRGWLERVHVPQGVATIVAILVVFALLAGFVGAFVIAIAQFTTLLPQFAPQIEQIGASIASALSGIGIGQDQIDALLAGFDPTKLVDVVTGILGGVAGITVSLVIILTVLILMTMDATYIPTLLLQLRPKHPDIVSALMGFSVGVRRYMVATTALGVAQGILNWIALVILQVPGALLWGLLSFLCSFIPNIGYFIALIPPTVFGLFVGGWETALTVIVIYGVVNGVVQSIVQPRVVGGAVSLNQTITFVSVLFWAVVIGPIGAILAVPLTLLVRAILIDADPRARWWRPLTGDIAEVRNMIKVEKAKARSDRQSRKNAPR